VTTLGTPRADGSILFTSRIRRAIIRQHSRVASATITKSREMAAVLQGKVQALRTELVTGPIEQAPLCGTFCKAL
jgi:hypothetical protein